MMRESANLFVVKKISIEDCDLWLTNARHGFEFNNEQDVMDWFATKHKNALQKNITSILEEGGFFNEPYVLEENGRYIVIDGNTRFAALKIIKGYNNFQNNESFLKWVEKNVSDKNDVFKSINTLSAKIIQESDIDRVVDHEHTDGMKKASYDPYRQAKIKGEWQAEIKPHIEHEKISKYLLERFLSKERANYIGIDWDSKKKLTSCITDEVKENLKKLSNRIISEGVKGQVKKEDLDKIFFDTFQKETAVQEKSPELLNLEEQNPDNVKQQKYIQTPNTDNHKINSENIKEKMISLAKELEQCIGKDKTAYVLFSYFTQNIKYKGKEEQIWQYLVRPLLSSLYCVKKNYDQSNKNDYKITEHFPIESKSREHIDSKDADKAIETFKEVTHARKILKPEEFYVNFNSLFPYIENAVSELKKGKD